MTTDTCNRLIADSINCGKRQFRRVLNCTMGRGIIISIICTVMCEFAVDGGGTGGMGGWRGGAGGAGGERGQGGVKSTVLIYPSENIATRNLLLKQSPENRPFIITRSTFAGTGRLSGHW